MIKINDKKLKSCSFGSKILSKIYKGDKLVWKKMFEGIDLIIRGSVRFNGGWGRELPLNVPLKLIVNGAGYGVEVTFSGKSYRPLYRGSIFMLKNDGVLTLSNEQVINIRIEQTDEQARYIFE